MVKFGVALRTLVQGYAGKPSPACARPMRDTMPCRPLCHVSKWVVELETFRKACKTRHLNVSDLRVQINRREIRVCPNTVHLRRIRLCPAAETNRRGTDGADDCSLSEQYWGMPAYRR
jgi:hypothetical protein